MPRSSHVAAALFALVAGLAPVLVLTGAEASAAPEAGGFEVTEDVPAAVDAQYSDGVGISFSATSDLGAVTASATGLPAGLALTRTPATDPGTLPSSASWSVTGAVADVLGSYPVLLTVSDGTSTPYEIDTTIQVDAEDATASYTGDSSVEAPTGGDDATDVTLSATVTQTADGTPGDITKATVTFKDTVMSEVLCANRPVNASGHASCTYSADIPEESGRYYAISVLVGGRFTGTGSGVLSVFIDHTDPNTTISSGPADGAFVLGTSTSFGLSASESPVTFACRLDGAPKSCPSSSVSLTGLSRGTHHFGVTATDPAGNSDETPPARRFGVPFDDTDMDVASGEWQLRSNRGAYLGNYLMTKQKGATLGYRVTRASSLAVVVGKGPKLGKVKVLLNGALLRTISLKGPASLRQLVSVASFASPRSGTVTIQSVSKKQVWIDGFGVVTAP